MRSPPLHFPDTDEFPSPEATDGLFLSVPGPGRAKQRAAAGTDVTSIAPRPRRSRIRSLTVGEMADLGVRAWVEERHLAGVGPADPEGRVTGG